ncbi:hypothetical protein C1895_03735 [Pseudomonas sp. FW305-3-2-15-E-TSA4]|nr:hypothetical protein C1895_03735 [Pseudomonas sp. FW305-3-2-15-E-TSA4]
MKPLPLWGRACSRKGRVRHSISQQTHRFRQQARSHIEYSNSVFLSDKKPANQARRAAESHQ